MYHGAAVAMWSPETGRRPSSTEPALAGPLLHLPRAAADGVADCPQQARAWIELEAPRIVDEPIGSKPRRRGLHRLTTGHAAGRAEARDSAAFDAAARVLSEATKTDR